MLLAFVYLADAQSNDNYTEKIMAGISNNGQTNERQYLTPGDRTYIVGTQNGNFPDLGSHVKGEMGGLWMPPVKLVDGFWLKISDDQAKTGVWLKEARESFFVFNKRFQQLGVVVISVGKEKSLNSKDIPVRGNYHDRFHQICVLKRPGLLLYFKVGRFLNIQISSVHY